MDKPVSFFIIDDDRSIVLLLKNLLSKIFPKSIVFAEGDGKVAWERLMTIDHNTIIICDVYLPSINGLQILKNVRQHEELKDLYFIVITSDVEKDTNLKALQQGADDFFTKPFSIDQLLSKLRSATRIVEMQMELKEENQKLKEFNEELERESMKVKDFITTFMGYKLENTEKFITSVREKAKWVAEELDEEDFNLKELEEAASLHMVGRMILPEKNIKDPIMAAGQVKNEIMAKVPVFAREIISKIRGFENVAEVVGHIYENFDGSGIPDKYIGPQIPLASRILRTVIDYEEMVSIGKMTVAKAMESLEHEGHRLYDFNIITYLDQWHAHTSGGKEQHVKKNELLEGMILSRHINVNSGMKILAAGTALNTENIDKIRSMTHEDPIIGKIYIRVKH